MMVFVCFYEILKTKVRIKYEIYEKFEKMEVCFNGGR